MTRRPRFAALLWQLVEACAHLDVGRRLDPPPPWVAWDHEGAGIWPLREAGERDLNADPGPRWLNEIGARARTLLLGFRAPPVVGHVDWESQNIRWNNREILVVHDWDSAASRPEATIAGAAAAVFASADAPGGSTPEESERFLDAYQRERGRAFTKTGLSAAWAAGLWVRASDTKENSVNLRDDPEPYASELWERLRRATG